MSGDDVLASQYLNYPLRQYMYCGPDEGAAAAVLCRADIAHKYTDTPIYLRASQLVSRREGALELMSPALSLEDTASPTIFASRQAYEEAGISPQDVDVIQLQDTDAGSELIHMAENGFCLDGEQEKLLAENATDIGGRLPVNTDGGLMANGEPVGASGLRQVYELANQLRGRCGERQVADARVGYAQLYGMPGTAAVTILST
jgi:acetyl-CoA acetyltransferase